MALPRSLSSRCVLLCGRLSILQGPATVLGYHHASRAVCIPTLRLTPGWHPLRKSRRPSALRGGGGAPESPTRSERGRSSQDAWAVPAPAMAAARGRASLAFLAFGTAAAKRPGSNLSGGEKTCSVLSCSALSCSVLSCSVLSCSVMLCHALFCHALFCHALFCHALSCSIMLYHALF